MIVLHFAVMNLPEQDQNGAVLLLYLICVLEAYYNPIYWLFTDDKALDETFKKIKNAFLALYSFCKQLF